MNLRKKILTILSIILAVFFTIGIIMYLCGCHDVLQPNCLRFYKTEAKSIDHFTVKKTCSECVTYIYVSRTLICSLYRYFDCYTSYAVLEFNILMKRSCNLAVVNYESETLSLAKAKSEYNLFKFYNIYVDKNSFECSSESNITSIAIAGFIFLVLTSLVLIVFIIFLINYCFYLKRNKKFNNNENNQKYQIGNNNNLLRLDMNHPLGIEVNSGQEQKGNQANNESANNGISNNNNVNINNGEVLSLNIRRNINKNINNENINDEENKEEGNRLDKKQSSKNMELANLKDAPLPDS